MIVSEYAAAAPIIRGAAEAFRPPKNLRVSQGAEQALMLRQPGGYSGPWSPTEAPYMIEPMDMLASRRHEAVCFVGPARTGKTMGLVDGWFAHAVVNDPGDMLIVQMTQEKAREFSKVRIDRAIRHSPEIRSRMSARGHDDNTHDKLTRHGMWIKIGWPSATQLASSDYRYVVLTDYDRMPDNVDGEGSAYALAVKRTQTFLSRGMCMVESSPGREYLDPHFTPSTHHEAPPASGIIGIYNRSDRRRWYWKCPDCSLYFEAAPGLVLFATLPPEDELLDVVRGADLSQIAAEHALVCCPHCGSQIEHKWKHTLNDIRTARWVADGQEVDTDGVISGVAPQSSIAGYWLGGVAAAYQKWESILLRYLQGLREYALSGSDLTLKTTINTDQGMPYLPRHLVEEKGIALESRTEDLARYFVPEWSRMLVASVDVQGGMKARFVVQVHAIGVDLESAVVDRYDITESGRGDDVRIDPAGYPEDWDVLTDRVVQSTYRLEDGREMKVLAVGVDTGGESGTTQQAYQWYRRLKQQHLRQRVFLLKGSSNKQRFPVQKSEGRDPRGRPMRDVTIHMVDTDFFKDMVSASMRRMEAGPQYMHFPSWLKQWFFDELRAEVRNASGKWKPLRKRNEALDLWGYILAVCYILGPGNPLKSFLWEAPPPWAAHIDSNSHVMTSDERRAAMASRGTPQPAPRPRRAASRKDSHGFGSDDWNL